METKACFIFALLLLLFSKSALSATRTAVASGNWATNSVWDCNCAPSASDNIIIPSGFTITVSSLLLNLSNATNIAITVNGTLLIQDSTIYLDNGDTVNVNSGGKIQAAGLVGGSITQGVSLPLLLLTGQSMSGPFTISGGALPITLIYFRASANETGFTIEWQSATEINFSHYQLQKSTDGVEFFDLAKIFSVEPAADGTRHYQFEDHHLFCEKTVFYRLISIDLDASEQLHEMVAVKFDGPCTKQVTLFPNPATGLELNWSSNFLIEKGDLVKLVDPNGIVVQTEELNENQNSIQLNLTNGLYFMMLVTKKETFTMNFLVTGR